MYSRLSIERWREKGRDVKQRACWTDWSLFSRTTSYIYDPLTSFAHEYTHTPMTMRRKNNAPRSFKRFTILRVPSLGCLVLFIHTLSLSPFFSFALAFLSLYVSPSINPSSNVHTHVRAYRSWNSYTDVEANTYFSLYFILSVSLVIPLFSIVNIGRAAKTGCIFRVFAIWGKNILTKFETRNSLAENTLRYIIHRLISRYFSPHG